MRGPEMMIAILNEMKDQPDGRLLIGPSVYAMPEQLGRDATTWNCSRTPASLARESESIVRITSDGYDFLNALQQGPSYRKIFMDGIGKGRTIADSVNAVVTTVGHLT